MSAASRTRSTRRESDWAWAVPTPSERLATQAPARIVLQRLPGLPGATRVGLVIEHILR